MTYVTEVRPACEDTVRNTVDAAAWRLPFRLGAATVMAGCAALHVLAAGGGAASGMQVLMLLAMAGACLPCATHALLAPTRRTWIQAAVVAGGMLVAHPLLGLLDPGHHVHGGGSSAGLVGAAMVVGPAVALVLACAGAVTEARAAARA